MDGNMWTFILCLTSMTMYQAAGKTGKKVQTRLRRLTFMIPSGIKPAVRNSTADSTCLNFAFFFFNFRGHVGGVFVVSTIELNNLHELGLVPGGEKCFCS